MVNFNGKKGCQKCTITTVHGNSRTYYPLGEYPHRTDANFRARIDINHHKTRSIIENLGFDMIYSFPTSDPLHLMELGILKRCFIRWVFGKKKEYKRKWSKAHIDLCSRMLLRCQQCMPSDFHRSIRKLDSLRQWKGVEFRTVLLYVGIAVFKNILPDNEYEHFLTLFCACTICSCNLYKELQPLAKIMFKSYVKNYGRLYGEYSVGSNVHNLDHVVDDMQRNDVGNLIDISTYKYENALRLLGLQLKHGRLPLEQISRRIIETATINKDSNSIFNDKMLINKSNIQPSNGFNPIISFQFQTENDSACTYTKYKKIQITPSVMLSTRKFGDSWFMTTTGEIVKMSYVFKEKNKFHIAGHTIEQKSSFFSRPIDSAKLKIYCSNGIVSNVLQIYDLSSILTKIICVPLNETFIYMPILHTMESLHTFHRQT